jgi:hypothetical protein
MVSSVGGLGVKCVICDERVGQRLVKKVWTEGYEKWFCLGCEGTYAIPRAEAPREYFQYFPGGIVNERWEYRLCSDRVRKENPNWHVDIGAGNGSFLSRLEGIRRIAVERATIEPLSHTSYDEKLNDVLDIPAGSLSVSAFHVLEHLADPKKFLSDVATRMGKDGLLYLSFPNPKRLNNKFYEDPLDTPPHHLTHFTEKTISVLAEATGFCLVAVEKEPWQPMYARLASQTFYSYFRTRYGGESVKWLSDRRWLLPLKVMLFAPSYIYCKLLSSMETKKQGFSSFFILRRC